MRSTGYMLITREHRTNDPVKSNQVMNRWKLLPSLSPVPQCRSILFSYKGLQFPSILVHTTFYWLLLFNSSSNELSLSQQLLKIPFRGKVGARCATYDWTCFGTYSTNRFSFSSHSLHAQILSRLPNLVFQF